MEHSRRYYEPIASWLSDAGIFVSAVNPILIKEFGDDSLCTSKTDKADAKKIAWYALDHWINLKQYNHIDEMHNHFKTRNRPFGFYMDHKTAMNDNPLALLDQTFRGANNCFDSPARSDGCQKWLDFVHTYWHVDCVQDRSLEAFAHHCQNWCRRKGYNFSASKAQTIYNKSSDKPCQNGSCRKTPFPQQSCCSSFPHLATPVISVWGSGYRTHAASSRYCF